MIKLTDHKFYKENETMYDVLTDYINNLPQVVVTKVEPKETMSIELDDCFLNAEGNLYVPFFYEWTEKTEEGNVYKALYSVTPTLTKLEIANMVAQVEQPELNNPANHAN